MLEMTFGGEDLLSLAPGPANNKFINQTIPESIQERISTDLYPAPRLDAAWEAKNCKSDNFQIQPPNWPDSPKVKINQMYWPASGATRFAYVYVLMTKESFEALEARDEVFDFVATHNSQEINVKMYPLQPRVLITQAELITEPEYDDPSPARPTTDLYVVPLVDERYFWMQTRIHGGDDTVALWSDLFTKIKAVAGTQRTITTDTNAGAILDLATDTDLYPGRALTHGFNNVAAVMDTMAETLQFRYFCLPTNNPAAVSKFADPPSFDALGEIQGTRPTLSTANKQIIQKLSGGKITPRMPDNFTFIYKDSSGNDAVYDKVRDSKFDAIGWKNTPAWSLVCHLATDAIPDGYDIEGFFDRYAERNAAWRAYNYDVTYSGIRIDHEPITNTIDEIVYDLGCLDDHGKPRVQTRLITRRPSVHCVNLYGITTKDCVNKVPKFVQAPQAGIPARSGATPGSASCDVLVEAPSAGVGYSEGDLVKNGNQIVVKNWTQEVAGVEGDRLVAVGGHFDGTYLIVWECDNQGDPDDFETLSSSSGGGSI